MAEITIQKSKGADLTWVWAIAAIASIIGFMAWLFVNQPASTAVNTEAAEEVVAATPATLAAIANAPDHFGSDPVQVDQLNVAALLGQRVFWAMPEGASPVLVVVGPEVADVSWVAEGNTVSSVIGTVEAVTEPILDSLVSTGALLAEGKSQAVFSQYYLAINEVTP